MEEPERPEVDGELLRTLGIGAALAAAFGFFGPLRWILSTMATLFHEMGHAAAAWLFGRPAIPKFDLAYGGGFTSMEERSGFLVLCVAAGWAGLAWSRRGDRAVLAAVLGAAGVWALLAFVEGGRGGEIAILSMGHGGELLLGGLFLWRGLTGASVVHPAERPLYAAIGLFVILEAALFAAGLLRDDEARAMYEAGKGGLLPNDFVQIADLLGTRLDAVVIAFLAACLATPVLAAACWWRRDLLARAWERASA